jgi:hypothetical protein
MPRSFAFVIPVAFLASACGITKSVAPTSLTVGAASEPASAPVTPPPIDYPTNGPDVIAYVAAKYPEKLVGGISLEERVANMQFLRDRVIEVGKCGGLDLGWNLKRGGPDISNDFITERVGGTVLGHDIGFAYDDPGQTLQLYWGDGSLPFYKEYPQPSC